ncbi:transporter [Rhodococcus erythropolis]|jgi:hypothetical protein|uniref:Transporter n=1 Tax=Rhodococcus baikonurensis TaxID=172041 RepID=A0ABV5XNA6_9NOCA|nr:MULTISPECIES: transporter [Rhodococcus]NHP14194.1 transporter [Rhodococcus sp. IC4_135]MBT2267518.1 transporter [Rhodococcus erythropolis]MDI9956579.1 transporter [Rhodococcus sp. IEGM 1237]MDI9964011.1 transporter [Rhodococcus sp. IEGM 1251]MDV8124366.1 transporter [Rhodococcus sp. IEGM 1304]
MDRALWIIGLAIFWVAMIGLMYVGWRGRARRQKDRIGELPTVPATLGELLVLPTTGLYVGSTIAPSWQDRIAVGDLGFRATCEISRYSGGILVERDGASAIWIPEKSIRAIRTENGLAGKVMSKDGVLVIRWELPSGTEIDTGVRGDDKTVYPDWVKPVTASNKTASNKTNDNEDASSGDIEQNGKNA